jgi:anti-sigma B factor antagonist
MAEPIETLNLTVRGDVCVATLSGEIDLSNRDAVAEQLQAAADSGRHLVVDLDRLSYLDSSGISMLFELHGQLSAADRSLRLVASPDLVVWRVLSLTGLTTAVPHHPDLSEALDATARI